VGYSSTACPNMLQVIIGFLLKTKNLGLAGFVFVFAQ
jgi:hypothetical protein